GAVPREMVGERVVGGALEGDALEAKLDGALGGPAHDVSIVGGRGGARLEDADAVFDPVAPGVGGDGAGGIAEYDDLYRRVIVGAFAEAAPSLAAADRAGEAGAAGFVERAHGVAVGILIRAQGKRGAGALRVAGAELEAGHEHARGVAKLV